MDTVSWCSQSRTPVTASFYESPVKDATEFGFALKAGLGIRRIPLTTFKIKPSAGTLRMYASLMDDYVQALNVQRPAAQTTATSISGKFNRTSTRSFDRAVPSPNSSGPVKPPSGLRGTTCVLVLDNDRSLQPKIEKYLAYLGYTVRFAGTGLDGLSAVKSHQPVALIVCQDMPAMAGLSVLELIRKRAATGVPAICFSARINDAMKQTANALGRVTLIPTGRALAGDIVSWIQDTLPPLEYSALPEPLAAPATAAAAPVASALPIEQPQNMTREQLFDYLWGRLGGHTLDEVATILGTEITLSPAGGSWHKFAFAGSTIKLLVKKQKISILGIE